MIGIQPRKGYPVSYAATAHRLVQKLAADPLVGPHIDSTLQSPAPHGPMRGARLVILGQDPTVKRVASRRLISKVLNLDKPGSLRTYLDGVCRKLSLDLDREVYSTNLVNAFFRDPPASDSAMLRRAAQIWRPLLSEELTAHPNAWIITLGEPLLDTIVTGDAPRKVRDYWGYEEGHNVGDPAKFAFLPAQNNRLGRPLFPFPHQPSIRKRFYACTLGAYAGFVTAHIDKVNTDTA